MAEPRQNWAAVRTGVWIFFFATLLLAAEVIFYLFRGIFLATLIAIGLGVLLAPLMRILETRLRMPRGLSAMLFFVLSLALVGGIGLLIHSLLSGQLVPFFERAPELWAKAQARVSGFLAGYPSLHARIPSLDFGAAVTLVSQHLAQGLKLGVAALGGFVFVLVLALYLAMSPDYYLNGMLSMLPERKRAGARELVEACAVSLRSWFVSQLVAMAAVGGGTALGLLLLGIDSWPVLGLLTALLDIVPYVGPLVAGATSVLVTIVTEPGKTIWVLLVFMAMQQVEAHLVIPLVMKGRIDLPPALLMVLMLVLGSGFGALGVLVAPGLLAVLRTIYLRAYLPLVEKAPEAPRRKSA